MKPSKSLVAQWYRKLKKSGFNDIEAPGRDTLQKWDSSHFKGKYSSTEFAAKQRYYELAGHFLNEYKFKTARDKKIWQLHAAGETFRFIADEVGVSLFTVQQRIKYYAAHFKS